MKMSVHPLVLIDSFRSVNLKMTLDMGGLSHHPTFYPCLPLALPATHKWKGARVTSRLEVSDVKIWWLSCLVLSSKTMKWFYHFDRQNCHFVKLSASKTPVPYSQPLKKVNKLIILIADVQSIEGS